MNPLLKILQSSKQVPIPASTETDKTYWFINNGTLSESEYALIVNASDPVTKNPIGSIVYVIHNDFMSSLNVSNISSQHMMHPHIVSIHEWQAAMNGERGGKINWDLCLTPVKVLGKIQEGYK